MAHVVYHNTTPLSGDALLDAVRKAKTQDDAVLAIFQAGGVWSPSKVHYYMQLAGHDQILLTSVRRAISNLTKAGHLRVTGGTVPGPYGRPENTWSKA